MSENNEYLELFEKYFQNLNPWLENLDVVVLIDNSSSLNDKSPSNINEPATESFIDHINETLKKLIISLKNDPELQNRANIFLTVITFNDKFEFVIKGELIESIDQNNIPQIISEGATIPAPAFNEALDFCLERYDYWRSKGLERLHPLFYYFTDGLVDAGIAEGKSERDENEQKTAVADYDAACRRLKEQVDSKKITLVACGFTDHADISELEKITDFSKKISSSVDIKYMNLFFEEIIQRTIVNHTKNKSMPDPDSVFNGLIRQK